MSCSNSSAEPTPRPRAAQPRYRLRIERLELWVRLGCTVGERERPQRVAVSVSVDFAGEPRACQSDALEHTVCAAALAAALRGVADSDEFSLIEHLAWRLHAAAAQLLTAGTCLELELEKLAPPIPGLTGGVSFSIAT